MQQKKIDESAFFFRGRYMSISSQKPKIYLRARRMHKIIRISAMSAILIVGILSVCEYIYVLREENRRFQDAEAMNLAGRQRMFSQRIARFAEEAIRDPSKIFALETALSGMKHDAEKLDLLDSAWGEAVLHGNWIECRKEFWNNTEDFIKSLKEKSTAKSNVLVAKVSTSAEIFLLKMESAVLSLQEVVEGKSTAAHQVDILRLIAKISFLLLLLIFGVEPLARYIRLHNQRFTKYAKELELLSLVANVTSNSVIITDRNGIAIWANAAFTRMSGFEISELLGRQPGDLLQSDLTATDTRTLIKNAILTGESIRCEILNRRKNGEDYWLDMDIQPLYNIRNELTGFMSVQSDITARITEQHRLRTFLDALPAGVIVQQPDGTIEDANLAAQKILGNAIGSCAADTIYSGWLLLQSDCAIPSDERIHPAALSFRLGEELKNIGLSVRQLDGSFLRLRANIAPLRDSLGEKYGTISAFIDETEVHNQREMLRLTVEGAELGTWNWNLESGNVELSHQWYSMLGRVHPHLTQSIQAFNELTHPDDLPSVQAALTKHFSDSSCPYRTEFRMLCADGTWKWILSSGAVLERTAGGEPIKMAGIHLDINGRKLLEQEIAMFAKTDALTGLPNRVQLKEKLSYLLQKNRESPDSRFGLVFMDCDRFKLVNDSLGHHVGDELLREVSKRIRHIIEEDSQFLGINGQYCMAARWGGDEFVIVLEHSGTADIVRNFADHLLSNLELPYKVGTTSIQSSVSIGIVISEEIGENADANIILRNADAAMYEAKRRGRGNYVFFENSMHERLARTLHLGNELRIAIESPNIWVAYQSIVDLKDRRIVCVEALARWDHPILGNISPVEFIPIAEEYGLICALGKKILRQACQDWKQWQDVLGESAPKSVSVNLSRAKIINREIVGFVKEVLRELHMPPDSLQLEVTESMAMQTSESLQILEELVFFGVRLALDDFGTGHSSLSTLNQLPLYCVKMDQSFVSGVERGGYHAALIRATVDVAKAAGIATVAEGVETEMQADFLMKHGCKFAQGYLFGRPSTSGIFVSGILHGS